MITITIHTTSDGVERERVRVEAPLEGAGAWPAEWSAEMAAAAGAAEISRALGADLERGRLVALDRDDADEPREVAPDAGQA